MMNLLQDLLELFPIQTKIQNTTDWYLKIILYRSIRNVTSWNSKIDSRIPSVSNYLLIASLIHFSACVNCPSRIYNLASWIKTSQFSLFIESDWTNIFIADSKSPSCSDTNPDINKIFDWFLKYIIRLFVQYIGSYVLPFTDRSNFIDTFVGFSNFSDFDKNLSHITPRIYQKIRFWRKCFFWSIVWNNWLDLSQIWFSQKYTFLIARWRYDFGA